MVYCLPAQRPLETRLLCIFREGDRLRRKTPLLDAHTNPTKAGLIYGIPHRTRSYRSTSFNSNGMWNCRNRYIAEATNGKIAETANGTMSVGWIRGVRMLLLHSWVRLTKNDSWWWRQENDDQENETSIPEQVAGLHTNPPSPVRGFCVQYNRNRDD
jgi:hypothetical protein